MNNLVANTKYECSGCGACLETCPCNAISMDYDTFGVKYATIDLSKCIHCGKCHLVCPFSSTNSSHIPLESFAAKTICTDIMTSASGGLFAAFAKKIIDDGGSVYGAIYQNQNDGLFVKHACARTLEEVESMKGSKYVQSSMDGIYSSVIKDINSGRRVLFCGTPCQCKAIKNYTKNLDCNSKLIVLDIVCHGVPSQKMFSEFIDYIEKKYNCKIESFNFRDKKRGWGSICSVSYFINGRIKKKYLYPSEVSYYSLFENCMIMRPSCYKCKFASSSRAGDITIGDYWGIGKMQPELLNKETGAFDSKEGISLMLVNSEIGRKFVEETQNYIRKEKAPLESLMYMNPQLSHPTECDINQVKEYADAFVKGGYIEIERMWKHRNKAIRFKRYIINRVPVGLKRMLKKL